jgi:single-strand DNA-binding protein
VMNEAQVTVVGYIASTPRLIVTKTGRFVTSMRVGMTPRKLDKDTGQWSDGDTTYVTVTCWRALASNVASCLRKGDPVVIKGRMRVREFDDKEGRQRVEVEVDASTVGHDLSRGVAHFLRTKRAPGEAPPLQLVRPQVAGDPALAASGGAPGQHGGGGDDGRADAVAAGEAAPRFPAGDEFAEADLFDDAGIEASSLGAVAGGGYDGAGGGDDGAGGAVSADAADAPRLGRAA